MSAVPPPHKPSFYTCIKEVCAENSLCSVQTYYDICGLNVSQALVQPPRVEGVNPCRFGNRCRQTHASEEWAKWVADNAWAIWSPIKFNRTRGVLERALLSLIAKKQEEQRIKAVFKGISQEAAAVAIERELQANLRTMFYTAACTLVYQQSLEIQAQHGLWVNPAFYGHMMVPWTA